MRLCLVNKGLKDRASPNKTHFTNSKDLQLLFKGLKLGKEDLLKQV